MKIPPEFARAERFDGVFFFDLPGRDQQDAIWGIYQENLRPGREEAPAGRHQLDQGRDEELLQAGVALVAAR